MTPPREFLTHLIGNWELTGQMGETPLHQSVEAKCLHLFDTFGVTRDDVLGIGKRKGNTIPFVFNYSTGPFTNLFTWGAQRGEWKMELTFSDHGAIKTFATKRMTRK